MWGRRLRPQHLCSQLRPQYTQWYSFFLPKFTTSDLCIMLSLIFLNWVWWNLKPVSSIYILRIINFCVCLKCSFNFHFEKSAVTIDLLLGAENDHRMCMLLLVTPPFPQCRITNQQRTHIIYKSDDTAWISATVLLNLIHMWRWKLLIKLSISCSHFQDLEVFIGPRVVIVWVIKVFESLYKKIRIDICQGKSLYLSFSHSILNPRKRDWNSFCCGL